jgi:acyl carrier protein
MTREEISGVLRKIIHDCVTDVSINDIHIDSNLRNDLCMDSMDILSVFSDIEDTFDISFNSDEIGDFHTFGDIVDAVCDNISHQQ